MTTADLEGSGYGGARIGLLEARMAGELTRMIERQGGVVRHAPALMETTIGGAPAVPDFLDALARGEVDLVVLMTGVGVTALFDEAEDVGRLDELVSGLQATVRVCRGQKPWKPLKARGVAPGVTVPSPYTTKEVVETLDNIGVAGKGVALVHYGERSDALARAVTEGGGKLFELCLYEWKIPADTSTLEGLIDAVIQGEIDAMVFTTKVQVRHLLEVASMSGRRDRLIEALGDTVVAAVGPTCAAALETVGLQPDVVPQNPKMGPMIAALGDFLRDGRAARRSTSP